LILDSSFLILDSSFLINLFIYFIYQRHPAARRPPITPSTGLLLRVTVRTTATVVSAVSSGEISGIKAELQIQFSGQGDGITVDSTRRPAPWTEVSVSIKAFGKQAQVVNPASEIQTRKKAPATGCPVPPALQFRNSEKTPCPKKRVNVFRCTDPVADIVLFMRVCDIVFTHYLLLFDRPATMCSLFSKCMEFDRMTCYVFPPFYIQLSELDTETEQRGRFSYRRLQSVYMERKAE
jgi:hypothetical protein